MGFASEATEEAGAEGAAGGAAMHGRVNATARKATMPAERVRAIMVVRR